ncbi:MAG: hypothetical protein FWD96_06710 [Defluviitaleaceae bacterium]|nr:hypothetical protein [Defluviitaleaceae bacterium]
MKRHIRLVTSAAVTGAIILSMSASVFAANVPSGQPTTRPGVTAPATPVAPAPNAPTVLPAPAPNAPTTLPAPAPNRPERPERPGRPERPVAPTQPQTPSTRPQPAPGTNAPGVNHPQHNNPQHNNPHHNNPHQPGRGTTGRLGNSTLSNLVEYYENLVNQGVISYETASRIIDYMLNRYTGVSSNIGQVGAENKSSSIKFEQRADGGAMFFEQKPDGKIIFFEQTPGKGAVYHEHNPFGNVNALNSAIVHSQMVNEGVITQAEAQAITNYEARTDKENEVDK